MAAGRAPAPRRAAFYGRGQRPTPRPGISISLARGVKAGGGTRRAPLAAQEPGHLPRAGTESRPIGAVLRPLAALRPYRPLSPLPQARGNFFKTHLGSGAPAVKFAGARGGSGEPYLAPRELRWF